jgi:hypothetical protein
MSNAVFYVLYKLKKGACPQDFLLASEKLMSEYTSKAKGYISWQQLVDGETWLDLITFETMEDAKNFEKKSAENPNELALYFYSFINFNTCKQHYFTIERTYKL